MRLWPAASLVGAVCVLGMPLPTWAATVSVTPATDPSHAPYKVANYRASPGETNQLRLVRSLSPLGVVHIRVTDAGAPLAAGPGCTALDAHTADCAPVLDAQVLYGTLWADARLGDGDDTAEAVVDSTTIESGAAGNFDLWGEDGDDRLSIPSYEYYYGDLHGGPGEDVLHNFGYAGAQILDGGPGADEIVGGRGYDTLRDGDPDDAPVPDTMEGGGGRGRDVLSYEGSARSLRIDLEGGRSGSVGEGDKSTGVEDVRGGRSDDVIRGSRRAESLDGGGGRDFISGRSGGDDIRLDRGRAIGGPGEDAIRLRGVASIVCGPDRDLVEELARPSTGPYLARDCEQLHQGDKGYDTPTGITVDPRAHASVNGLIRLSIRCGDCSRGRTRVTATRRPFRTFARDPFRLHPPDLNADDQSWLGSASVVIPPRVTKSARRRRVSLRFVLEARGEHAVWTVRLRRSR